MDRKIKIVRIIGRLNVGGPAIHVVNLTAELDPKRYATTLITGKENPREGSMLDFALIRGVEPYAIPEIVTAFSFGPRDLKALIKLYQLLRRERPDIVHTHTAKAGFLGRVAAYLAGAPVIVHTFHGHVLAGYYGPVKNWLLRRIERLLAAFTDKLITVSEQVKIELVAHAVASAEKISVIPLGFDLEPFLNARLHRGGFRGEMGLDDGVRLIGIVGRLFPIKNHRLFLDAAARIAAQDRSTRFVIVGDGTLREHLEMQACELNLVERVIFTGWRRDLPHIYADLDVLAISSDNEGTPVSAIEAMAAGCPVVATRVGGLPDIIDDRRSGRLVPPGDADALADAILDLLRSPEQSRGLAESARAEVQRRFTTTRLISDMDHLYTSLLGESAHNIPARQGIAAASQ